VRWPIAEGASASRAHLERDFVLCLPAAGDGRGRRGGYRFGAVAGGAERILFVDDEEDIVKLETRLLRDLGDGLVSRTSSLAALQVFSADPHAFDLVISDFTMPKMTGGELIGKVRELRPAIPAILISGFHDATVYAERSAEVPPMECVKKPFSRAELAQAIRRALDRRAAVARELDVS
jgi:CheY-like chemotaxis protein